VLLTFIWHHVSSLHVHFAAPACADFVDAVAHLVAAILAAAKAHAFVEGVFGAAVVSQTLLLLVHQ